MAIPYLWSNGFIELDCYIEYDSGERATMYEPGYSSSAYVESAKHKGVDITEILSEITLNEIADDFLLEYESQDGQYEPDYESILESKRGWLD